MKYTIKQIADLAGVSRGTVDRVIHNRYGVHPDVKERVEKLLAEIDYKPNVVAQALKRSEKSMDLGFIITDINNPFWNRIVNGFRDAEREYESHGVKLTQINMKEITPAEQIRCLDDLRNSKKELSGIFLAGINSPIITDYINDLPESLPVITYNTDLNGSKRLCFVGQNHLAAGHVAGRLMSLLLQHDGEIASFVGMKKTLAHVERFSGFKESMSELRPNSVVVDPTFHVETDAAGYTAAAKTLKNPNITALYVTGEGSIGVAHALKESGRRPDVKMICYDMLDDIVEAVKQDVIDITIGQQEYTQGYLPVKLMYEYLTFGTVPPRKKIYTDIDIRVKENIDYRNFDVL